MNLLRSLKRYAMIYRIQLKNNFVREAVYRENFITAIAVDVAWIIVEIAFFGVIYENVPTIAGWTRHQVYFFLGIFFASDALFSTLFMRNFFYFPNLITKGELDIILTKPVHPVFLALTRWINFASLCNFALGLGIAFHFAGPAGFSGGWKWWLLIFWLWVGLLSAILLRFAFSVWIFWTDRNWALLRLYYQFFTFATKPDPIYPKYLRYAILTILPFGFIGSVPARALLNGLESWEYAAIILSLSGLFVLNTILWRKGLRRYQSASS